MAIDYNLPSKRDKLAITLAKYATLWAARDKGDDRGKAEFQADGLIEEGWVVWTQ